MIEQRIKEEGYYNYSLERRAVWIGNLDKESTKEIDK